MIVKRLKEGFLKTTTQIFGIIAFAGFAAAHT